MRQQTSIGADPAQVRRKLLRILRLSLATSLWLGSSLALVAETVTVNPTITDAVLANPFKGFAPPASAFYASPVVPQSLFYADITWLLLEPTRGSADWAYFERNWKRHTDLGRKVGFRFQCLKPSDAAEVDVPQWLVDMGVPLRNYTYTSGRTGKVVDWDNATFLDEHDRIVALLAARYNDDPRVAWLDVGSYGFYGEWHMYLNEGLAASQASKKRMLDAYLNNFTNKKLVIAFDDLYATKYLADHGGGVRNDCLGDSAHNDYFVRHTQEAGVDIEEVFQQGILTGEFCNGESGALESITTRFDLNLAFLTTYHWSFIGPAGGGLLNTTDPAVRLNVEAFHKRLAYNFAVTRLTHDDAVAPGGTLALSLTTTNTGAAPFYYPWPVELALLNGAGAVAFSTSLTAINPACDPRLWNPGESTVSVAIPVPGTLPTGDYALCLAILDPDTGQPGVQFNNTGRDAAGRYLFSSLSVASSSPPPPNNPPTLSAIADQSTSVNTPLTVSFTVGDPETAADSLSLAATSSNSKLVPNGSLVLGGSGANRTLTVTPAANQSGSATITVSVSDGSLTTSGSFFLQVNAPVAPPTVSLTSPADNATFTSPADVTLSANAADSDGTISKVEFYSDATLLGTVTTLPYDFSWTGVPAGTYSLTAKATDDTGAATISAAVTISVSAAPGSTYTLAPLGSTWRYLDNGSDQGTSWRAPGFDDSGWAAGPAKLGYGDGDEATVIGFGPNAANKYITTYFRQSFSVPAGMAFDSLTLRLLRDDGGVVYLNGTEVFRSNMPVGAVTYTTRASTTVEGTYWDDQTDVSPALLVSGQNVLAVEIHQASPSTSDLEFDLELSGAGSGQTNSPPTVSLTSPANDTTVTAPASIAISASAADSDGTVSKVEFFNDATLLATLTGPPYTYTWAGVPAGSYILTAKATDNANATTTSAPVNIAVVAPNTPPTLSAIADQSTSENTALTVSFTVADAETPAESLQVSATGSDAALVPPSGLVLGGNGASRTLTITPAPNAFGATTVTVSVSDGTASTSTDFALTVTEEGQVPSPPDSPKNLRLVLAP